MMDGLQPPIPGKVASLQATDLVQLLFVSDLVTLRCVWGGRSFRSATQGILTGKRTNLPVILLTELGLMFSTAMPNATAVC